MAMLLGKRAVGSWEGWQWFHNGRRWLCPSGNHRVTLAVRAGQMQIQRKSSTDKCLLDTAKPFKRQAVNKMTMPVPCSEPNVAVAWEESYAGILCVN